MTKRVTTTQLNRETLPDSIDGRLTSVDARHGEFGPAVQPTRPIAWSQNVRRSPRATVAGEALRVSKRHEVPCPVGRYANLWISELPARIESLTHPIGPGIGHF